MSNTTPQNQAFLQAKGLKKTYRMGGRNLQVLRGVDVSVQKGQWLAILGSSGSGKSTLLHLLGGLDRPDGNGGGGDSEGGTVIFSGRDIFQMRGSKLDYYRNQHVGFVFQFYHLLPELTALENVLAAAMIGCSPWTWLSRRVEAKCRAVSLLERMGLADRISHKPSKLSGGERQRVAIARALVNDPDVLLADEPTGNLDKKTGQKIIELLQEFHRDGQTIVMVTHDQKIASTADEVVTLEAGLLV